MVPFHPGGRGRFRGTFGSKMVKPLRMFAVASPGLENMLKDEIGRTLGRKALNLRVKKGGVAFSGHRDALFRANVELRLASRVLVRVGKFRAQDNRSFVQGLSRLDWSRFLPDPATGGSGVVTKFKRSVTSRKSKLYHKKMIDNLIRTAMRIVTDGNMDFIYGSKSEFASDVDDDDDDNDGHDPYDDDVEQQQVGVRRVDDEYFSGENVQHLIVSLFEDQVNVSINSSGAHLHKRLYRQGERAVQMPLKETGAAAMLAIMGFNGLEQGDGTSKFHFLADPFCGSGTIPIEAALLAANRAPGLVRLANSPDGVGYAFQNWPAFCDPEPFQSVVDAASALVRMPPAKPLIMGTDKSEDMVEIAQRCANRAGVGDWLSFEQCSLSNAPLASAWPHLEKAQGLVLSNPPFGPRAGAVTNFGPLYAKFGDAIRSDASNCRVGILAPSTPENKSLVYRTGLSGTWSERFTLGPRGLQMFVVNVK